MQLLDDLRCERQQVVEQFLNYWSIISEKQKKPTSVQVIAFSE